MSLSLANIKRAQVLLHSLATSGVRDFVVSPGSRNTPLILALEWLVAKRGNDTVSIHRMLDERSAGFFALGLGRLRGVPAALICTSGTAAAHYFPAVIEAAQSHVPLLVLSADRPQELRGVGSLQTIDQNKLFGNYTRLYTDMGAPTMEGPSDAWVAACALRAVDAACGYDAGPVHLNLPFREPLWTAQESVPDFELPSVPQVMHTHRRLCENQLEALRKTLGANKRGVIIAGPRDGACDEGERALAEKVQTLAAALGWPIIAEPGSGIRARLSQCDELIAPADVILRSEKVSQDLAPEFVLRFGKTPTSKVVRLWAAKHAHSTFVIEANPGWHDPDAVVTNIIHARALDVFTDLVDAAFKNDVDPSWLMRWEQAAKVAETKITEVSEEVFWEGAIARKVVEALPEKSLLHVSNSMPIRDLDAMVKSFPENTTVVHHRGANGIDGAISSLLGEAEASTLPSVLLCGDLTFLHDVGALHAATHQTNPLTIVVVDNRGGGIFEHLPIAKHPEAFERNFITPHQQDLVAMSRAAGVRAYQADDLQSVTDLLSEELERPGLGVIVVPTDRKLNTEAHRRLWREVEEALEREWL